MYFFAVLSAAVIVGAIKQSFADVTQDISSQNDVDPKCTYWIPPPPPPVKSRIPKLLSFLHKSPSKLPILRPDVENEDIMKIAAENYFNNIENVLNQIMPRLLGNECLEQEGILRISGTDKVAKTLYKKLVKNKQIKLKKSKCDDIVSAMKKFLKDHRLFPGADDAVCMTKKIKQYGSWVANGRQSGGKLPWYAAFEILANLAKRIVANEASNNMPLTNVLTTLSLNLFYAGSEEKTGTPISSTAAELTAIAQFPMKTFKKLYFTFLSGAFQKKE
eukprot:GEMP01021805.1.p1 GENE.GEMP01021805.1~~GEMP01021805.1.p1  ORF type:complete len:275 (-),score=24.13 GEMP01021805.1:1397-2221(-)